MQNHPMVSALALALLLFSAAACVRAPEQTGTVDTALEENSETSKDLTGVIWMLSGASCSPLAKMFSRETRSEKQGSMPISRPTARGRFRPLWVTILFEYPGCDPLGTPRILFYSTPLEFVQIPGRVFMFFQRTHQWRTIWTDGRSLPENSETRWHGHSL